MQQLKMATYFEEILGDMLLKVENMKNNCQHCPNWNSMQWTIEIQNTSQNISVWEQTSLWVRSRSWKKWRISCPRTRWRKGWQCLRQTSWRERSCWSTSGWRLMWKKQKWSFSSRWKLQNQIYESLNNRDNNADNDGQGALEVDDAAEDPNAAAPEKKPDEPTGGRIIELIPSSEKGLYENLCSQMGTF